jgi:hypothetical protein
MLYFTSSQVLVAIWVCENQNGFMWIHDVPHLSTVFFLNWRLVVGKCQDWTLKSPWSPLGGARTNAVVYET